MLLLLCIALACTQPVWCEIDNQAISNEEAAYLLSKIKLLSIEARRQVKLRHRQARTGCSDQQGIRELHGGPPRGLRVATYNLWNLNSNWDHRRQWIANMLRYLFPDIMAIQEIRFVPNDNNAEKESAEPKAKEETEGESEREKEYDERGDDVEMMRTHYPQLKTLAEAVGYKHWSVRSAAAAARHVGSTWTPPGGFNEEAVGVMSKHPIVQTEELALPPPDDCGDRNPRVVLAPLVNVTNDRFTGLVRVLSAHLSYVKEEQCRTVPLLLEWANQLLKRDAETYGQTVPQVLMGDLNFYFDYDWPADFLTRPPGHLSNSPLNPCADDFLPFFERNPEEPEAFTDAWSAVKPEDTGYTFPASEFSGTLPPARCDRILSRGFGGQGEDKAGQCGEDGQCEAATPGLSPSRAVVLGCRPIVQTGDKFMSDHFLVLADFV